jgi:hypothetical protein
MSRRLIAGLLTLAVVACAQHKVDPRNLYHRIIVVVPLVGQGTQADPKRPQYAPAPAIPAVSQVAPAPSTASTVATAPGAIGGATAPTILAYMHVLSDNGQYAITEFVAQNMAAFQAIMSDSALTVYVKGRDSKATIEAAMQVYKKNFSLDGFGVVMP